MTYYDEQLQILGQQVARKAHLKALLQDLQNQKESLEAKVADLEHIKQNEQKDVDRLERYSLTALFYAAIGKKEERLNKELDEAYAATAKYDAAASELAAVNEDIAKFKSELRSIANCENKYGCILKEKAKAIKESSTVCAEEMLAIEENLAQLDSKKKEIDEATVAGKEALRRAEAVAEKLDEAHEWGVWDLGRGSTFFDLAKYDSLDEAQELIKVLQIQLRRFKTELADVAVHADVCVSIDESLRFADYFFDNIFTDLTVLDKIEQSKKQIDSAIKQIHEALDKLLDMYQKVQQMQAAKSAALNDLIVKAKI